MYGLLNFVFCHMLTCLLHCQQSCAGTWCTCSPRHDSLTRSPQFWPGPSTARHGKQWARAGLARWSRPCLGRTPGMWASTARPGKKTASPVAVRATGLLRAQPPPPTPLNPNSHGAGCLEEFWWI